jgi:DNA-binding transcriptional regulator YiaG
MTAEQFKQARQSLGLTPERLAPLLGVTWRSVYRWEAGTVPVNPMAARLLASMVEQQQA